MKKIRSIKIKNSRKYFFLRILAWLAIKYVFLRNVIYIFFNIKKPLPLADVEAVYAHLDVEREAENVFLINQVFGSHLKGNLYDIGCNFMQFAKSVSTSFINVYV